MKGPEIPCPTCGVGFVSLKALKPSLAITYARFANGRRLSASMVYCQGGEGATVNAVNNRLEELRKLGFLDREKEGRNWMYFRPAKKE